MGYYTEFLRSPLDIIRARSLSLPRSLILKHTWSKAYLSLFLIEYVLISPQRSRLGLMNEIDGCKCERKY